jgi:hypothetical protein
LITSFLLLSLVSCVLFSSRFLNFIPSFGKTRAPYSQFGVL